MTAAISHGIQQVSVMTSGAAQVVGDVPRSRGAEPAGGVARRADTQPKASLTMIDRPEGLAPPPVVFFHLGGPAASRAAADPVWDEIALCNLVSAEAMAESIATSRNDR